MVTRTGFALSHNVRQWWSN